MFAISFHRHPADFFPIREHLSKIYHRTFGNAKRKPPILGISNEFCYQSISKSRPECVSFSEFDFREEMKKK